MWWVAMLLSGCDRSQPSAEALRGLAVWALGFSPRVTAVDEAVLVELQASARLFGGRQILRDRLQAQATELGVGAVAWAPTRLAALALARGGVSDTGGHVLEAALDALPLHVLSAAAEHRDTLAQMGCRFLGDLRRLPRGGISRRFGAALLTAMDLAYGLRPDACAWIAVPEQFSARLELPARVEAAPALLFGARRLLLQLAGWLTARQAGTSGITLRWAHDDMRARDAGDGGAMTIRTAEPTRDVEHLGRLLAEHLARVELAAPVGDLELTAHDVQPLAPGSGSLLLEDAGTGLPMHQVLERLAARLGPERVRRAVLVDDHRLEWMQHWQPASQPTQRRKMRDLVQPLPTFVLAQPLPLAMRGAQPVYQGPLMLRAGPQRIEGGWWHRVGDEGSRRSLHVQRDYWIAQSSHAGLLWIFQERPGRETGGGWFLHGAFA